MREYVIVAVCDTGHSMALRMEGGFGREAAEGLAGLIDGSSAMYLQRIGADSVVGKCGICGAGFRCEVVEELRAEGEAPARDADEKEISGTGREAYPTPDGCGRLTEGD